MSHGDLILVKLLCSPSEIVAGLTALRPNVSNEPSNGVHDVEICELAVSGSVSVHSCKM